MHVVSPCGLNPVIEDAEVKAAFFGLDLFPGHRQQDRIHMHARQPEDHEICLRGSSGRRVAEFAPKNQKWLAFYNELPSTVFHLDVGRIRGIDSGGCKMKANDEKGGALCKRQKGVLRGGVYCNRAEEKEDSVLPKDASEG